MWTQWTSLSLLILVVVLAFRTRILRTLAPQLCVDSLWWELYSRALGLR